MSERKKPLYQVPCPSTAFEGTAAMYADLLSFRYYKDEVLHWGGIRFRRVAATRTRAERSCTPWHIDVAYDTLVEVIDSPWVEKIQADTTALWRDKWGMHHYMIYLDSAGCFEIVAESWERAADEPVTPFSTS